MIVNSQPAACAPLSDGDVICIGKHRLRFSTRRPVASHLLDTSSTGQAQSHARTGPNPTELQVVAGPHTGAVYALSTALVTIGRTPDSGISLAGDNLASRQHASLLWNGKTWTIEDCGSRNGVYVNGQRISAQVINRGDEITVGQHPAGGLIITH